MKLTREDRFRWDTAMRTASEISHAARELDHLLTDAETRKLLAARDVLKTVMKRIEHGITP